MKTYDISTGYRILWKSKISGSQSWGGWLYPMMISKPFHIAKSYVPGVSFAVCQQKHIIFHGSWTSSLIWFQQPDYVQKMCLTRDDSIFSYVYLQTTSIHQASSKKFRPSQPLAAILAPATDLKKNEIRGSIHKDGFPQQKKVNNLKKCKLAAHCLLDQKIDNYHVKSLFNGKMWSINSITQYARKRETSTTERNSKCFS